MRRGEVVGLRWNHVDLDREMLSVVHTVSTVKGQRIFGEPNTDYVTRDFDRRIERLACRGSVFTTYDAPESDEVIRRVSLEDLRADAHSAL